MINKACEKEFCECGHGRDLHEDNLAALCGIHGHGGCSVLDCQCEKFTWTTKEKLMRNGVYDY